MMIGDILYITDDILFFCMALCGIYLFIGSSEILCDDLIVG